MVAVFAHVVIGIALGYGFRGLINRIGKSIVSFVRNTVEPRVAEVENRAIALEAKFKNELMAIEARVKADYDAVKVLVAPKA
jgi:hypothetical protein